METLLSKERASGICFKSGKLQVSSVCILRHRKLHRKSFCSQQERKIKDIFVQDAGQTEGCTHQNSNPTLVRIFVDFRDENVQFWLMV